MKKSKSQSAFSGPRTLIALLLCAATACLILTGTLPATAGKLAFLRPDVTAKVANRTLTFEERVSYQRAIEEVYWRHRIWPKERPDPKPSLDAVVPQAQLEKKVEDYLRNSQALGDYWQRPLSAEQLQAEMERMAQHTKQPEVLRELFDALGNDPFVIAECLARPALAERLVTNWYSYDQRIHDELKQRAEADLQAHNTVEQMKQTSGKYSEIELVKSDSAQGKANRGAERSLKLSGREWDENVHKLAAMFGSTKNGLARSQPGQSLLAAASGGGAPITQIKTGVVSSLQEGDGRYYATAVVGKTEDRLKVATVGWQKEPLEPWLARAENQLPTAIALPAASYTLPTISDGAGGCVDDTWTATASAPSARDSHTAVWTGSEMIIWGGYAGILLNTGGRYNPATDTWAATSTANAPSGRYNHTTVWTGGEMIIWGGNDGSSELNTGGRYNPSTDSWVGTSTTNAPIGRQLHIAVWTGSEMIVWGGTDINTSQYFNTGGRYNPSADSWTATTTTNAPSGRYGRTAVWTGTEMIVWGGLGMSGYLNTGSRYNPGTNSWTATSTINAPTGRYFHTTVWTGSEMIIWGGYPDLNTGGRYNPGTNSWTVTTTANAPTGRFGHTAAWSGSEMIIWGGTDIFNYFNTGGRYNPTTDSWIATSTTNAPPGRDSHTAIWTGTEMVVWGGYAVSVGDLSSGGRYNPTTDSWTATGTLSGRSGHTAVWTGSEMIIWGGIDQTEFRLNTGGRYNPAIDTWMTTNTASAPSGRFFHTAVWTGSEMIVWGGTDGSNDFNTGGKYNVTSDAWAATSTSNAPDGRNEHTAIWSGTEMVVWGGRSNFTNVNTGGKYNPTSDTWTPTSTSNAPSGRYNHTTVWTDNEMIVWGGFDGTDVLNTGGRYSPATDSWGATSTANAPSAREFHTVIWTGTEMIVWGGYIPVTNTGGRYNPATNSWTSTSIANAPSGRYFHTAVWTGNEMIVWGGYDANNIFNTGGRYDPVTDAWVLTSTLNAPSPRQYHTAVWTGSEMIVWGGTNNFTTFDTGGRYCAQSGPTPTPTPTPTPGAITLSAHGRRVQGRHTVDLSWTGATSANVDIFRDGVVIATAPNNGAYKDFIGVRGGNVRYTYKVCEAGTQTCSNQVTVRFGGPPL
jgi:N-acetylneuraminic acid mutarotase